MSVAKPDDPWQVKNNSTEQKENGNTEVIEKFEDNFNPNKEEKIGDNEARSNATNSKKLEPLPDSANYLQLLERKLQKIQKGSKLLDSLQEKKEDCMRTLLASDDSSVPATTLEELFEFDTPIESGRLHRHLLPVQAVTVGETLEIVKYDALIDQEDDDEEQEEQQKDNQDKDSI